MQRPTRSGSYDARQRLGWRGLAAEVYISRAFLNHVPLGKRVPLRRTAEVLIHGVGLDDEAAEGLRAVATPTWWERRAERL